MSDGCPIRECDDQREERFSVKNHRRSTAPIAFVRRADLGHSTTRVAPQSPNTQSPENCCLHLIPPYVYCISNEAYFSCRNICEAFFSIFFFGFGFCFFFLPAVDVYTETKGTSWAVQCHRPRRWRQVGRGTKEPTAQRAATRSPPTLRCCADMIL